MDTAVVAATVVTGKTAVVVGTVGKGRTAVLLAAAVGLDAEVVVPLGCWIRTVPGAVELLDGATALGDAGSAVADPGAAFVAVASVPLLEPGDEPPVGNWRAPASLVVSGATGVGKADTAVLGTGGDVDPAPVTATGRRDDGVALLATGA